MQLNCKVDRKRRQMLRKKTEQNNFIQLNTKQTKNMNEVDAKLND